MKRMLMKWVIDRAADTDRSLPAWAQGVVARDPELVAHERSTRAMVARLRNEADAWADADSQRGAPNEDIGVIGRIGGGGEWAGRFGLAIGLAAVLGLAALVWVTADLGGSGGNGGMGNDGRGGQVVISNDPMADPPIEHGPNESLDENEIVEWILSSRGSVRSTVRSWVVQPAEEAGVAAGRTMAMLDMGMEREREALRGDVQAAVNYYASRFSFISGN